MGFNPPTNLFLTSWDILVGKVDYTCFTHGNQERFPKKEVSHKKMDAFQNKLQGGPLLVISRVMTLINGRKMIGYQGLIASYYRGYNPLNTWIVGPPCRV